MSNPIKNNQDWDDFEELLENIFPETADEEDFGYFDPTFAGRNPFNGIDLDDDGDSPPPVPKEAECRHERWKKVDMVFTSFYFCEDCKKDLGTKAPHVKQKK